MQAMTTTLCHTMIVVLLSVVDPSVVITAIVFLVPCTPPPEEAPRCFHNLASLYILLIEDLTGVIFETIGAVFHHLNLY